MSNEEFNAILSDIIRNIATRYSYGNLLDGGEEPLCSRHLTKKNEVLHSYFLLLCINFVNLVRVTIKVFPFIMEA
jgi:hypothetical protein